ncbi:CTP synthase [Candidatus Woesearchaeota archaeon]|nr:CTP synthase [Candidatus Woesearchaeota archaeon]
MPHRKTRYIVVTGGVLSGLGKGVVVSSIGRILSFLGYKVTGVKIDPYINMDAGTMRPTEHGEVFVTYDGGETDQDIGTYERFFAGRLSRTANITTGQVYDTVIRRERNLEYAGKCVEVIPHIPEEVRRRIYGAARANDADFVVIEIGGTVGDYQNVLFLEAARHMKITRNNVVFVHVVYLPVPNNIGEMKTKPAQHSVRQLMENGIQPDFLVARSSRPVDEIRKEKLSIFCNTPKGNVISAPDVESIYELPLIFLGQGFHTSLLKKFHASLRPLRSAEVASWKRLVRRIKTVKDEVTVGIIGKYFDIGDFTLEDSYVSVIEAVKHAAWHCGMRPVVRWIDSKAYEKSRARLSELDGCDAVIVPGGFGASGVEGKIMAITYAREKRIPYLGLCYGMQLAVVEYARHAAGLKGAHTTEIDPKTRHPVIDILPEQKELLAKSDYGATMRLGEYPARLAEGTLVRRLYGKPLVHERHRHRYEVNPDYIGRLEAAGLVFSGKSPDRTLMEFMEIPDHPYFIGTQAHPEFTSRPMRPNPLFFGLLQAAKSRRRSRR